jgi:hypothetical protein
MPEISRPLKNLKKEAIRAIRITPSPSQLKALELFRGYLTAEQLDELDRKKYITVETETQEFRLSPHGRNGTILWRRAKTWKRKSPAPVCVTYTGFPPADAALTVLLLLRSGGHEALRGQIRGAVNIGLSD